MSVKSYTRLQPCEQLKAARLLQYSCASLLQIVEALEHLDPVFVVRKDGRIRPANAADLQALHSTLLNSQKGRL